MAEFDSKDWTGEKPKLPTISEMIDKYVPVHTRAEVWAMARSHEAEVNLLLGIIHRDQERIAQLSEHLHGLQRDYAAQYDLKLPMGRISGDMFLDPLAMATRYRIRWSPEPYQANMVVSDHMLFEARDRPYLFEAICKQFEEQLKQTLIPQLKREFAKLYHLTEGTV